MDEGGGGDRGSPGKAGLLQRQAPFLRGRMVEADRALVVRERVGPGRVQGEINEGDRVAAELFARICQLCLGVGIPTSSWPAAAPSPQRRAIRSNWLASRERSSFSSMAS